MSTEPTKRRPSAIETILPIVIGYFIWDALLLALIGLLKAAGAGDRIQNLTADFILLPVALILAAWLVGAFLNVRARLRGEPDVAFCMAFFLRLHRFSRIPWDEAEGEWSRMHRLPGGGQLINGWRCRDSSVLVLECRDTRGELCMLVGSVETRPTVRWVAGLYVRSTVDGQGSRTRRLRVFDHPDCHWAPMSQVRLDSELAEYAPGVQAAAGWCCSDCPAVRLEFTDEQGRPFLLVAGAVEWAGPEWYAGFVFNYGKALASGSRAAPSTSPRHTDPWLQRGP